MAAIQFCKQALSLLALEGTSFRFRYGGVARLPVYFGQPLHKSMRFLPQPSHLVPLRNHNLRDGIGQAKGNEVGSLSLSPVGHMPTVDGHGQPRNQTAKSNPFHNVNT